uniref:RNA-directed DNA polymerase n=1 Tax=Strongyloides papillosus TaxID=174720 RepID=A0A0N5BJ91_STREA
MITRSQSRRLAENSGTMEINENDNVNALETALNRMNELMEALPNRIAAEVQRQLNQQINLIEPHHRGVANEDADNRRPNNFDDNATLHENVTENNDDNLTIDHVNRTFDETSPIVLNNRSTTIGNNLAESLKPSKFSSTKVFSKWIKSFENFCELSGIHGEQRYKVLTLMLNDDILDEIDDTFEDYRSLVTYLSKHYTGTITAEAAIDELEFLYRKKIKSIKDLEQTAEKLSSLIDITHRDESKKSKLLAKISGMNRFMPDDVKRSLAAGRRDFSTFNEYVAVIKRVWNIPSYDNKFSNKSFKDNKDKKLYCSYCKKDNHSTERCFKKNKDSSQVNTIVSNSDNDDLLARVNNLKSKSNLIGDIVNVNGRNVVAMFDTGANCSLISPSVAKILVVKSKNNATLDTAGFSKIVRKILCPITFSYKGSSFTTDQNLYINNSEFSNGAYDILIGNNVLKEMKIKIDVENSEIIDDSELSPQINLTLERSDEDDIPNRETLIDELKQLYPNSFSKHPFDVGPGILCCPEFEFHTNKEPGKFPIYGVPINDRQEMNRQINLYKEQGVLEKSCGTTVLPTLLVNKKDNSKRLVVDCRITNSFTIPIRYRTKTIQEILAQIRNYTHASHIDFKNAYYQISIPKNCRSNFTIKSDDGLLQFTRLIQGAINSPSLFQLTLDQHFISLGDQIIIYQDDVLLLSNGTVKDHINLINKFFTLCEKVQLKVSMEKSTFFSKITSFLGYDILPNGAKPSQRNISSILAHPIPHTKKKLLSFVQAVAYFRHCIKNFAQRASSLYKLSSGKDNKISMNVDELNDFNYLRDEISKAPLLFHADPSKEYYLTVDASNTAVGAVLTQKDSSGKEQPISFYSCQLPDVKKNRSATYLELYAIKKALKFHKILLTGSKIIVRSDHRPLETLTFKNCDKKFMELMEDIRSYDVTINYLPGKDNSMADYLSRIDAPNNHVTPKVQKDVPTDTVTVFKNIVNTIDNKESKLDDISTDNVKRRGRPRKVNIIVKKNCVPNDKNNLLKMKKRGRKPKNIRVLDESENFLPSLEKFVSKRGEELENLDLKVCSNSLLEITHDYNNHFGFDKMFQLLKSRGVTDPALQNKIKLYIKNCDICQKRNINMKKFPHAEPIISSPGNLCLDLMGPISPPAYDNSKYVVCCMDSFTRYCYLFSVESYNFDELAPKLLNNVFYLHGFPKILKTDGSGNFRSNEFQNWLKSLSITHELTSPHHSTGNSLVERSFRWISDSISKVTHNQPNLWPKALQGIAYNYNTTVNKTTGYSPYFLTHLREPNTLLDQYIGTYSVGIFDSSNSSFEMINMANEVRQAASDSIYATRETANDNLKVHKMEDFKKGDLILIKQEDVDKEVGSKFRLNYVGPYTVEKCQNNHVYYIHGRKIKQAHISNVKRYYSSNDEIISK